MWRENFLLQLASKPEQLNYMSFVHVWYNWYQILLYFINLFLFNLLFSRHTFLFPVIFCFRHSTRPLPWFCSHRVMISFFFPDCNSYIYPVELFDERKISSKWVLETSGMLTPRSTDKDPGPAEPAGKEERGAGLKYFSYELLKTTGITRIRTWT